MLPYFDIFSYSIAHFSKASNTGKNFTPNSVNEYSTLGGISLYTIKILGAFQQNNYAMTQGNGDKQKAIAYFILLTCQIRYDLTGIEISPDSWYKIKINDYETNIENKIKFINATNEIVEELNLKEFMKIEKTVIVFKNIFKGFYK
jgi:hypothetical protein